HIIISTMNILNKAEEKQLIKATENISNKNITSKEQLIQQISLFLNPKVNHLVHAKNKLTSDANNLIVNDELTGKTVLMVDDDPRNIFAVSSALETYGLNIITTESGKQALQ